MEYTPTQWLEKGSWFNYNNFRIFYLKEGEGEPLLLLHGFPTASWDWNKVWDALKKKYTLITLDYLGYGFSDKPRKYQYSVKNNTDIAEALLNELQIVSYHILAHDVGDSVAQELLARQTERKKQQIESCCLLNGGLFPETHRPTRTQKLLLGRLGFLISQFINYKSFARSFTILFPAKTKPGEGELKMIYSLIQYNKGNRIAHLLIKYIVERRLNRERWVEGLQKANCPLLLIDGVDDPVSGKHLVERYCELVPQSAVVEIEDCGHYPQMEHPEKLLQAYFNFRKRI